MGLYFIGAIVAIIILVSKNDELKKENRKLKDSKNDLNICPNCGYNLTLSNVQNNSQISPNIEVNNNQSIVVNNTQNKEKNQEKENNMFFIIGSVLIILATIIFITSTWNIMPNIIKIIILYLMLSVFLIGSKIAKDKLKLPKTSKVFFNIGLAYIPISFLAISIFSLFGNYLSITGDGNYLFLGLGSLITFIVYYLVSIKDENNLVRVGSYCFNILSIVLITLFFTTNINIILIIIAIYDLILIMFHRLKLYLHNEYNHKTLIYVLAISVAAIGTVYNLFDLVVNNLYYMSLIILLFIITKSFFKKEEQKYISPILVIALTISIGINIYGRYANILFLQFLVFLSYIIILSHNILSNETSKQNYIIVSISHGILLITLFFDNSMSLYLYLLAYTLITLLAYISIESKYKKLLFNIALIFLQLSSISLVNEYNLNFNISLILSLIIYVVSKDTKILNLISVILMTLLLIIVIPTSKLFVLLIILFTIYNYLLKKHEILNYSYTILSVLLVVGLFNFDPSVIKYMYCVGLLITNLLYYIYKNKNIYKAITYTLSFILIRFIINDVNLDSSIVINLGTIYIYALIMLKDIINKYKVNNQVISGITYSLINLYAFTVYTNDIDGLLFAGMLAILSVIGYVIKDKLLTYLSLAFIILNVLIYTLNFWLNIPKWIYIFIIGIFLIIFAIRNERKKNLNQQDTNSINNKEI